MQRQTSATKRIKNGAASAKSTEAVTSNFSAATTDQPHNNVRHGHSGHSENEHPQRHDVILPFRIENANTLASVSRDIKARIHDEKARKIEMSSPYFTNDDKEKPSLETLIHMRRTIMSMVIEYIVAHKRIMYGGVALNQLISVKNAEDAIYKDPNSVPDTEFYTPEPVRDVVQICLLVHGAGFKNAIAMEAHHFETYTLSVDGWRCCDVSYMPARVYAMLPSIKMGIRIAHRDVETEVDVVHPHVMLIDYMRMLTDPMLSYWRLEKSFARLVLLLKHYPISVVPHAPCLADEKAAHLTFSMVAAFANERDTVVVIGEPAVAYYAQMAREALARQGRKKAASVPLSPPSDGDATIVDIPVFRPLYLEAVTTDFVQDAQRLLDLITGFFGFARDKVAYSEYYPFLDFVGRMGEFRVNDVLVARILDNNHKCVPYVPVTKPLAPSSTEKETAIDIATEVATSTKAKAAPTTRGTSSAAAKKSERPQPQPAIRLQMGSFTLVVMFLMMFALRAMVDGDDRTRERLRGLVSNMYRMRNTYLSVTKTTIVDDTPFQEFVTSCAGPVLAALDVKSRFVTPYREKVFQQDRQFYLDPSRYVLRNQHEVDRFIKRFKFFKRDGLLIVDPEDLAFRPGV